MICYIRLPSLFAIIRSIRKSHSVNDGIPPDLYLLRYIHVDNAIAALIRLGPGAMMAKFDVEAAYQNIPIHPDKQFLLGMRWHEQFFVDLTLPFGLRSAPFIFNSVADLVQWILQHHYRVRFLFHYLDDFLTLGPAGSNECAENVCISRIVFARLGLPLHPTKCEGQIVFLGIELDSVLQIARLPREKFLATLQLLRLWSTKAWCTWKELESLCGSLHHVCKVVPPGHSFLHGMLYVALDSSGSCGFGAVFVVVPGFMVVGRSTSARLRLLSPNCSPSWSQPIFGDFNRYASKSNSCVIIRQSWPS